MAVPADRLTSMTASQAQPAAAPTYGRTTIRRRLTMPEVASWRNEVEPFTTVSRPDGTQYIADVVPPVRVGVRWIPRQRRIEVNAAREARGRRRRDA